MNKGFCYYYTSDCNSIIGIMKAISLRCDKIAFVNTLHAGTEHKTKLGARV